MIHVFITHHWYLGTDLESPVAISLSSNNFADHIERKKKIGRRHLATLWVYLQRECSYQPIFVEYMPCKIIPQQSLDCLLFGAEASESISIEISKNEESNCRARIYLHTWSCQLSLLESGRMALSFACTEPPSLGKQRANLKGDSA